MFNEYGLLELNEVIIRNLYSIKEKEDLTVVIEAGYTGYSIIFSNYEIEYEENDSTPNVNLNREYIQRPAEQRRIPQFYDQIDSKVALLKLIPGTSSEVAQFLLEKNDALIIESFGVGGLPSYEDGAFFNVIKAGLEAGKIVVMTTQVENEGSDLDVYSVGSKLKQSLPVFEAYDMTTEAVTAKVMWILGQTKDRQWAEELFYTSIANDILK